MKLNVEKCHLMMIGNKTDDIRINVGSDVWITESENKKLFWVTFDEKLDFRANINEIYEKSTQKLHALACLSHYVEFVQLKSLMKSFIKSDFGYRLTIMMYHDRTLNAKINKMIGMVCKDSVSRCIIVKEKLCYHTSTKSAFADDCSL